MVDAELHEPDERAATIDPCSRRIDPINRSAKPEGTLVEYLVSPAQLLEEKRQTDGAIPAAD